MQLQEGREGAGEGAEVLTVREAPRVNSEHQPSAAEEGRGPTDVPTCASAPAPYKGQGQHPELSPSARPGLRAHSQSPARSVLLSAQLGGAAFCIRPSDGGARALRVRWGLWGGSRCPPRPPTLCPWLSPVTPHPWAPPPLVSSARFRAGLLPGLQAHPLAVPWTGPSGDPEPRAPLCRTSRETPGLLGGITTAPAQPLLTPSLTTQSSHSGLGFCLRGRPWLL